MTISNRKGLSNITMNIIDWLQVNISSVVRTVTNPLYSFISNLKYTYAPKPIKWNDVKHLPIQQYSDLLSKYKYYRDRTLDSTILTPEQFFQARDSDRDCDETAQMWVWWAIENDYTPQKLLVWEKDNLEKTCHMTCVLRDRQTKYYLCDYTYTPTPFNTLEQALLAIAKKYGYTKEIVWAYNS